MDVISRCRIAGNTQVSRTVANFMSDNPAWKKKAFAKQARSGHQGKKDIFTESRNCLVCKRKGHLVKDCRDSRKAEWIKNRANEMLVPSAVEGAATDTRASAATSGAQAATGVSHGEMTEVVGGAAKEIIAQTAVSRA